MRKPMQLPHFVEDWPELVKEDWYTSVTGEEVALAECWVRKSDGQIMRLTPPPPTRALA